MIRGFMGRGFAIHKKSLKNKTVQVYHLNQEGTTVTEYWIYKRPEKKSLITGFIRKGRPMLSAIIVCENDTTWTYPSQPDVIYVRGIKITGMDINEEYLKKTKRHADNVMDDPLEKYQDKGFKDMNVKDGDFN